MNLIFLQNTNPYLYTFCLLSFAVQFTIFLFDSLCLPLFHVSEEKINFVSFHCNDLIG